ncbi:MAG: 5-(carboxyamino)imidazole ribonucleotide synthase [Saprospiraceae bacterium]
MGSKGINSKIGVLGGGQLGKMLAQAAADWNLDISVLDPTPQAPANCCAKQVHGDFNNYDNVLAFGQQQDIITIEIEHVNLEALKELKRLGKEVYPDPSSLGLIQDKGLQKLFYREHQLPTSEFIIVDNAVHIHQLIEQNIIAFPFVQKLRRAGYDGRGVQIIHEESELDKLFNEPSVIEQKVAIHKEIAVLAARNISGEIMIYDPVEMLFHPTANLLLYQECPCTLNGDQSEQVKNLAHTLIEKMNIVGLLAVELFLDKKGNILINEVAPRPHNSGHHTIEACPTSQFQQHLRCILDFPLGPALTNVHSILLNLLGEPGYQGEAIYEGIEECLALDGVYIHLYGKKETKPMRKMGHITIVGKDPVYVKKIATSVSEKIKVIAHL